MPLTRREFSAAAVGSIALAVLPISSPARAESAEDKKANLATTPFAIGALPQYKKPGLYNGYKKDKGVWIVSDGKVLTVLSATCTHRGCTTRWQEDKAVFACPCHESKFGLDGENLLSWQ